MAKKFVKVSLAIKLRILFAGAVIVIIAAALLAPWFFMERLAELPVQRTGYELTRMWMNEWIGDHRAAETGQSQIAKLYGAGSHPGDPAESRRGPSLIRIQPDMTPNLGPNASVRDRRETADAMKVFLGDSGETLSLIKSQEHGRDVYRCFRVVRVGSDCLSCHGPDQPIDRQFQPNQIVGLVDMTIPFNADEFAMPLWLTRSAFIIGGTLAALLAVIVSATITQRLILRPIRELRDVSDKVTEGDLTIRSTIRTGDELQHLGESFNEMLGAISDQHGKLRAANRALDLRLHELAEANVALFQANKVKSEFLANMSHELRTPLNSIIGFADLVAGDDDAKLQRYGKNIAIAARNLLSMINDLLDLAKIEAGRAEVNIDRVSITDVCQTLLALMAPLADKQQLTLVAELAEDVPIVATDAGRLQQILYNLLSNAIKFTPAGGSVTISAVRHRARSSNAALEEVAIAVADTGPGIAEADQPHIFEKFYQIDPTLTRQASGAGLGLAIAKELAALMGGRLTLQSSPGHGAVFTVLLPINGPDISQPPEPRQNNELS